MKVIIVLILAFSITCNSTTDKIKCIVNNKIVLNEITEVINSFKKDETINIIIKIFDAFMKIKEEIKNCLYEEPEPILKVGCRYEEQFHYCLENSCDYMDKYECYEYCYRKYC